MSSIATRSARAAAVLFLAAGVAHADEAAIRKSFAASMPDVRIESVRALSNVPGLYEVVFNGRNIAYTDARGATAFLGRMVDVGSQRDLTDQRMLELSRVDVSGLPLADAIKEVRGNGSRKLVLFSDPDCPFCKQLEKELAGVTDVTIYTFLFPIAQLHPDATRKARLVWCAPDRARAWSDLMLSGREPSNEATCAAPINANIELAQKLGIEGTPGLVFASGRLVPGAIPKPEIERLLSEPATARN